jgi:hypothetical protein
MPETFLKSELFLVGTQGFGLAKQELYRLSHTSKSILLQLFWRWNSLNYLLRLASNYDPPNSQLPK